ncbi:VOC family protein [Tabrizicola sp.]|uniref:VOC family protein n=1 Tax=Tabrizicola sp. TaxID=2005166 RepID=UPI003F3FF4B6
MTIKLQTIDSIVFPARDLATGVATWTGLLGSEPVYANDDFAAFQAGEIGISLTRLPWVDHPLVFWRVEDIADAHAALLAQGATAMVEVDGGTLAELGTATASAGNQDPETGIVDMGMAKLAVLKAADGSLIALSQPIGT